MANSSSLYRSQSWTGYRLVAEGGKPPGFVGLDGFHAEQCGNTQISFILQIFGHVTKSNVTP